MKTIIVLVLFSVLSLSGCMSEIKSEEYTKGWVGRSLSEKKEAVLRPESYASRTGWKETAYKLANGNSVYVEPARKDCSIHWEINPEGFIIGYRTEGTACD